MTATRAQHAEALGLSSDALTAFTKHLQTCPACRPVRTDCPAREELYRTAKRLDQEADDMVTCWAEARRSEAAAWPSDA
jgi:hypothetical protein